MAIASLVPAGGGTPPFRCKPSCPLVPETSLLSFSDIHGFWRKILPPEGLGLRFLTAAFRRIGARLYLALGFAVFLTLFSSAVGVYYFERSGDLNFQLRSESVPVLVSAWEATRGVDSLRLIGHEMLRESDPAGVEVRSSMAQAVFEDLEGELRVVGGAPALAGSAALVQVQANELLTVLDNIALNRLSQIESQAGAVRNSFTGRAWGEYWWYRSVRRPGCGRPSSSPGICPSWGCPLMGLVNWGLSGMMLLLSRAHLWGNSGRRSPPWSWVKAVSLTFG